MVNPNQHKGKDSQKAFAFNKVSNIVASQSIVAFFFPLVKEIFMDIQTLIHLILDGHNVCIFAYG
jgi:hypothetical protein